MAVAIKPLRRRRRTAQRGKSMSQSQRWGKVVTTMPVPGGEITSTDLWTASAQEVVEEFSEDQAAYDAAMADAIEEAKDKVNDLPKLS